MKQTRSEEDETKLTIKRSATLLVCTAGIFLFPPPFSQIATVLTGFFFLKQIYHIVELIKS